MRDVVLTRRSTLTLALAAMSAPLTAAARQATPESTSASPIKLAEQTVELTERGVIWQATTLQSIDTGAPAWPFHAGFLAALDMPLTVLDINGAPVSSIEPGGALAVTEQTYLAPTSNTPNTPYLAIELVGQDDSDSPYRRPFKADPGQYTLTLWSLSANAGTDDSIATLLAGNLRGAPVMISVLAGGVAIQSADSKRSAQIIQGNWGAVDANSTIMVPGAVSAQLLIATITSAGAGGDNDLGSGSASASTTGKPSSIVETSLSGITLLNYRTTSLKAGELTWQVVSGVADRNPIETRYQRGFIVALNGPIALTEEDGTFRRIGGGNAITVRNGDRFSAESLTAEQEPFIAIELLAAGDASDPSALTFTIPNGQFTFELWRIALQNENLDALHAFMQDSPFPSLFFIQRGELDVMLAGESAPASLAAGISRVIAPSAEFSLTGSSASVLIGRLISL